jgi:hypothetical protein
VAINRNINDPWISVTNTSASIYDADGTAHPGGFLTLSNVLPDEKPYTCLFVLDAHCVTGGFAYVPWGVGPWRKFEALTDSVLVHTAPADNPDPTTVGYSKFLLNGDTLFDGMRSGGTVTTRTLGFNNCVAVTPSSTSTGAEVQSVSDAVARAAICVVNLPKVAYDDAAFMANICNGQYFNACRPVFCARADVRQPYRRAVLAGGPGDRA